MIDIIIVLLKFYEAWKNRLISEDSGKVYTTFKTKIYYKDGWFHNVCYTAEELFHTVLFTFLARI